MQKSDDTLEQKIKRLESENRLLAQKNERYKNIVKEHEHIISEFRFEIEQARKLQNQYNDAISMANEARKTYTKEMQDLIQQIKQA